MAVSPAGLSRTPSVLAAGVNEWPVPVILTGRPSAAAFVTSAATSAADPGIRTRAGLAETLPAQLRQEVVSRLVMVKHPPGQVSQIQVAALNSACCWSSLVRSRRSPATQIRTPAAPQHAANAKPHLAPTASMMWPEKAEPRATPTETVELSHAIASVVRCGGACRSRIA